MANRWSDPRLLPTMFLWIATVQRLRRRLDHSRLRHRYWLRPITAAAATLSALASDHVPDRATHWRDQSLPLISTMTPCQAAFRHGLRGYASLDPNRRHRRVAEALINAATIAQPVEALPPLRPPQPPPLFPTASMRLRCRVCRPSLDQPRREKLPTLPPDACITTTTPLMKYPCPSLCLWRINTHPGADLTLSRLASLKVMSLAQMVMTGTDSLETSDVTKVGIIEEGGWIMT